jgi:hypothetical protein
MADNETDPDPLETLVSKVNEGTRTIVNEILDERLRVNDPPPPTDGDGKDGEGKDGEGSGGGGNSDGDGKADGDPPPAPKTLAERLGF